MNVQTENYALLKLICQQAITWTSEDCHPCKWM